LSILLRHISWFLILLAGMMADISSTVSFPSDEALKIHLPEWTPRERGERDVQRDAWKHSRQPIKFDYMRRVDLEVMDKCPEFQMMLPCQCKEKKNGLDITCENVETSQLQMVTDNMKEYIKIQDFTIGFFKVRSSQLKTLPDYLFMGLKIVHLMLFDCGLHNLMPNSLSALAGSLKHLVLSNNKLTQVPSFALRQLRELDHINLNQNNISEINDGAFWGLSKVTRLSLYDNKISKIYPDAFDGLTKDLLRLNVGRNHLTEIPSQSLLKLKNLNHLDLSSNKINDLTGKPFEGLEKLDKLELNHNKIDQLVNYSFEGLPKLTSLSIDYNKIRIVEAMAFNGLDAQLQTLSMAANKLSFVPTEPLRPLHQLITLHLNDNNISRLYSDTFDEYGEHIQNLWLQNNKIAEIESECFHKLSTLEWLKINNNRLRSLPYHLMEPVLGSLKYIDVYKNPLKCDCEMRWYKKWYFKVNETDHMRDITCVSDDGEDILMKNVDLEDMYCTSAELLETDEDYSSDNGTTSAACLLLSSVTSILLMAVFQKHF